MRRTLTSLALAAGLAIVPTAALAQQEAENGYTPTQPPIEQQFPECEENAGAGAGGADACDPSTEQTLAATGVDAAWIALAGGALAATGAGGVLAARRRRTS